MGTVRKLIVEVVDARNLPPKDGHGTCSPYVILDFYGQRKKTRTVIRDLNPAWNETLEFNVGKPSDVLGDMLELEMYHDRKVGPTTRNHFLGRLKLSSRQFVRKGEEALIYYPLEKKTLFSWIQGEIGLKIYFADEVIPPPGPPALPTPPPEEAKPEQTSQTPAAAEEASPEAAAAPPSDSPPPPPEATEPVCEKPDAASETNPEQPKEPASGGEKPATEQPPVPPAEAAPPPETASVSSDVADHEKQDVAPDHLPAQEGTDPVDLSPQQTVQLDNGLDHMMASVASGSMAEVKINNINGPQPISRVSSVSSFLSDASDRSTIERSSFDLVEKMHYLFVRVVKARSLPTMGRPVVKIVVSGCHIISKPARKTTLFEWDQTFAFSRDAPDCSSILEISVWDPIHAMSGGGSADVAGHNFLGGICFDVSEIPLRDPPDSPLAPQWYRLEGGGAHKGDLMLATWVGTQADESFPEAWKTDTAGNPNSKSKVYQSPKLWYLRSTIIEAQDIFPLMSSKESSFQVKVQLGFQVQKTKSSVSSNGSPSWNEDLVFVAAEPFTEHPLMFSLIENRQPKEQVMLGVASIPLASIERRVDDRNVVSRWLTLEDPKEAKRAYKGRVHLKLCFDGGYHVMDEAAHVCSDYRPTARQLWKPPIGTVELGVIGCRNLLPMKTIKGKGSTDAYAVAKYGSKWVRTRTISDSLDPKWNEQYTWRVYDPSTVLTIGVFDSWEVLESDGSKESMRPDFRIGKVRIRISTLGTGKVYRNTFPLFLLSNNSGLKKMGEIELAVRFARATPTLDFLHVYSQPLLPMMHHTKPLGMVQQEVLRTTAVKMVAAHLSRSEPPLRREVVTYMLDADSHAFSMRKVRANWFRIINVIAGVTDVVKWLDDTRSWKNPTATILVHALLVMLVWFPDLIVPTFAFYVFVVGAWNYRVRPRDSLPHFDPKLSLAESIDRDEVDEEFDAMPCARANEVVRARYDKLRMLGARVQTVLGDFATQGERLQALVAWRDPRATGIFIGLCFGVSFILCLVPSKMIAMAFGFYYLRHPIFRDRMPSPALNFFRRLPSLSDRML
ncbi:multiple C2 domain and transmembrane region protein 16 [Coffea arabica]|uniref:Multiple C2 domain and transmembrane region protein 16 n=1 Tax=Coffea arabica TaxID=13443 RepID=A0A6P6SS09_COFAR|nr:FT-interacting protein 7 [Coffea arabica]